LAQRRAVSQREQKRFRLIGNARLATAIVGVGMAFFVFGETIIPAWALIIPVLLFWVLVVLHARVVPTLQSANRPVTFYERGMARLEHRWMGKGEQGERFRSPSHGH